MKREKWSVKQIKGNNSLVQSNLFSYPARHGVHITLAIFHIPVADVGNFFEGDNSHEEFLRLPHGWHCRVSWPRDIMHHQTVVVPFAYLQKKQQSLKQTVLFRTKIIKSKEKKKRKGKYRQTRKSTWKRQKEYIVVDFCSFKWITSRNSHFFKNNSLHFFPQIW